MTALRLTGILVSWAILLQSVEFLFIRKSPIERMLNSLRALLSCGLLMGSLVGAPFDPALFGILALMNWAALWPFFGLFNGGSDTLGMMLLIALAFTRLEGMSEKVLIWMGCLSLLSYFLSGVRKGLRREWWTGEALRAFLGGSRVSVLGDSGWISSGAWVRCAGPLVVVAQVLAPVWVLWGGAGPWVLLAGGIFHLMNFVFFGLNRFFWVWIASYPAVVWLGSRGPSLASFH